MDRKWKALRYLGLSAGLTFGVVSWEYLLNALMNPQINWNLPGVGAHMALDVAIMLPLLALALGLGLVLARRLGMSTGESAGLLGTVGVVALVSMALMLPVTSSRDLAHEWMGYTYGLSLAEVQTTVVRSDLTVRDATQLCSFGSVRNPSLARDTYQSFELTVLTRVAAGLTDVLKQQAALLPLLFLGFFGLTRREATRWSAAPVVELLRTRTVRLSAVGAVSAFALFCVGVGFDDSGVAVAVAQEPDRFNACTDGGPVREYDISAIDVTITLNRWGDHVNDAFMYALDANIADIRAEEADLEAGRLAEFNAGGFVEDAAKVSFGLRDDLIQPLVIRANLGECLRINFTNRIQLDGQPASLHILGLPHTVENAGSAVGNNPDTFAAPGESITYEIPLPLDMDAERAYYFHDHGAGRRRQNKGLFGAIVAEPPGSKYFDAVTGEELTNATGSGWEAIIQVPDTFDGPVNSTSVDGGDNISFREFVVIYHEIGDEFFTDIRDKDFKKVPLVDDVAGVYRPGARALNYRSEPFRRRLEFDKEINKDVFKNGKKHGYASYPFGDPPTPLPRSYVGEPTKTRLMHGSSEVFHVHHLHGGGDRWRRNPNADPNNDFWKGLTKNPDPNLTSIHLDSQSIGPGTSYNLEHECGAGGCQQGVGDFLFHCHIGHHYIAGMWSFWRVFGTVQTEENNVYGIPLAVKDFLWQTDNPFSDEEAPGNTPPGEAISAGDLAGIVVDGGRTLTHGASSATEMNIQEWVRHILPPAGVTDDNNDSTVLDWIFEGEGENLRVMGEPEEEPFVGYVSPIGAGNRIEITFNPKNARYTWPLYRPHQAKRMPFTARHTGAPWLGEGTDFGRIDGLCARPGFHDSIDENLPTTSVKRFYPISAITLPIEVGPGKIDPDGQIFVLNEEEAVIRENEAIVVNGGNLPADGSYLERKRAEPLAIRSNVGDCNELIFTNKIPDGPLNKDWSNVNMHHHFMQFDTQASDGVITGFSYEQAVRPIEVEDRRLVQRARPGATSVVVNHVDGLHAELVPGNLAISGTGMAQSGGHGIWIGIGLGEGVCDNDPVTGQPMPCTEIRQITSINDNGDGTFIVGFDEPLANNHRRNEAVGVEFVRYHFYNDVDYGTVFYHTHVEFKDWDHGLFGSHISQPAGSTYHDPVTGEEIRSGTIVDIHVDESMPVCDGNRRTGCRNAVGAGIDGSFREFMVFLHNNNPVQGRFQRGGGTINLRAESWQDRLIANPDRSQIFSSTTHGDPNTQEVLAYVGDPIVLRGMGLVERVGGIRVTGHRWNAERFSAESDPRDNMYIGISERFDVAFIAGGAQKLPGDYLYFSTMGRDFESGAWGLIRVFGEENAQVLPLPDNPADSLDIGLDDVCPPGAPLKQFEVEITDATIVYNDLVIPTDNGTVVTPAVVDRSGVAYIVDDDDEGEDDDDGEDGEDDEGEDDDDGGGQVREPAVIRVNAGDCFEITLENERTRASGISIGEVAFNPQDSYGSAIGFNADSTVPPGEERTYRYYADRDLGLVATLNLGDILSVEKGAFAGVVVEPEGATIAEVVDRPDGTASGLQADITTPDGVTWREFVALFNDQDRRIGQNAMPYPQNVENNNGISYAMEPLAFRGLNSAPADVFKSIDAETGERVWGDPRNVVEVQAGTPLIYRVGNAWGNQAHVPTLEGHRWYFEPDMVGSEQMFNDVLAPGEHKNFIFVGGAGGDIAAPGDYLFLDRRQPFLEGGMWHILRVTE